MWEHLIGSISVPVKNKIEKEAIKTFIQAIGEPLSIYHSSIHQKMIAPPTFVRTLDFGKIEGLTLPKAGLIHGEQTYHYTRPIYEDDVIYGQCQLLSLNKKKNGKLLFIQLKQVGYSESVKMENEVFTSIRTLVMTERLLREVEMDG